MKVSTGACRWIWLMLVFFIMAPGVSAAEKVFTLDESIETALKQSVLRKACWGRRPRKRRPSRDFFPS
jgi:hypothetical protein